MMPAVMVKNAGMDGKGKTNHIDAPLAQRIEHAATNCGVEGSNPSWSTRIRILFC